MITALKLCGVILLILVGYHYINEPLGFSVAGSIATVIFAICLAELYQSYQPDTGNWIGWGLIGLGCLFLAGFTTFSWFLVLPALMIILGYRLASLPFDFSLSRRGDGGTGAGFDSCDGDGGGGD